MTSALVRFRNPAWPLTTGMSPASMAWMPHLKMSHWRDLALVISSSGTVWDEVKGEEGSGYPVKWYAHIVLATQEAEAESSLEPKRLK